MSGSRAEEAFRIGIWAGEGSDLIDATWKGDLAIPMTGRRESRESRALQSALPTASRCRLRREECE
jgi:hypothetical protein